MHLMKKCLALACALMMIALPVLAESFEALKQATAADRVVLALREEDISIDRQEMYAQMLRYDQALAAFDDEEALIGLGSVDDVPSGRQIMPISDWYDGLSYLSLSPDGERFFGIVEGKQPMVYDFATQSVRLIVPAPDMTADYYQDFYRTMLRMPEDKALSWSPEGDYIAMAFPRKVLMEARVGANILLIDVAKAEARPIVQDLPAGTRIGEYEAGLPVKAGFDPAGDKLYYELYGLQQEERANAFMAYDLASGQSSFYAGAEWTNTTLDGRL